ncbi:MAG: cohesin domain-containing protein, partial [Candidatus Bathyarchaeia archaeon]
MSKILSQILVVLTLLIILGPIPSFQSSEHPLADTQVYVSPSFVSEPVDATFSIEVGIADVIDIQGFDIILGWNPSVLDYETHTATPEAVLIPVVFTLANTVDTTAGTYRLAAASLGGGFSGSGTIFSLTLKAKAEGFSALEFLLHDLADSASVEIEHDLVNGTFDNRPPPMQYEMNIGVVGSGTTDPVPGAYLYGEGAEVIVEAFPDSGWAFEYWLLDSVDVGSVNPFTVTMDGNHSLTAVFVEV